MAAFTFNFQTPGEIDLIAKPIRARLCVLRAMLQCEYVASIHAQLTDELGVLVEYFHELDLARRGMMAAQGLPDYDDDEGLPY